VWRRVVFAIFAIVLALQLFVPPFAGLANNGDFPRVTGWLSIGPKDHGWPDNFLYFVSDYIRDAHYFWPSGVYSSELPLAWLGTRFGLDIRCVGAVHASLFLAAVWLALRRLTLPAALVALIVFTDLGYTAYFNSFYMDTAALLGLLLMVALAEKPGAWFAAAALLFVLSKPQHAAFAILPAALLWFRGRRALAGAVLAAALVSPFTVPAAIRQQALFDLVFCKIAQDTGDLAQLGLPASDAKYIGMNSYQPNSPGNDAQWLARFGRQTGYAAAAMFYVHHPLRTAGFLWQDLTREAFQIRPVNLRTIRREDAGRTGFHYTFWSDFRSWLFRVWPWHIVVWYAAVVWFAIQRRSVLVLGLCALALGEFFVASLTAASETYRHLFLFHAITDVTVCAAVAVLQTHPAPSTYTIQNAEHAP
jgi:hypothetical protein